MFVEENNGVQRLPLSGGGHVPLYSQMAEKGLDFGFSHIFGMLLRAMKSDEP
jgi:hypothetical protein